MSEVYEGLYQQRALRLREDFCGTALWIAEWVKSDPLRHAMGLDLDAPTLEWGVKHNLAAVGEPGNRVRLLNQNVLDPVGTKSHLTLGVGSNPLLVGGVGGCTYAWATPLGIATGSHLGKPWVILPTATNRP